MSQNKPLFLKIVLINNDQCINADIVLDVGYNLKKIHHRMKLKLNDCACKRV